MQIGARALTMAVDGRYCFAAVDGLNRAEWRCLSSEQQPTPVAALQLAAVGDLGLTR